MEKLISASAIGKEQEKEKIRMEFLQIDQWGNIWVWALFVMYTYVLIVDTMHLP